MNQFRYLLLITLMAIIMSNCSQTDTIKKDNKEDMVPPKTAQDPHTFANPQKTLMNHLNLDIEVDFKEKKIFGAAEIKFENHNSEVLFLDTKGLDIQSVKIGDREVEYVLHDEIPEMGSALEIAIDTFTKAVKIKYSTTEGAEALQWLSPSQTAGKRAPFLFTQSQAILARTWVPCQDSPGIRFTYNATVKVPENLIALMSAENPVEKAEDGIYTFNMHQPIPAYLLALTVGDVAYKKTGKRTGVYAELSMLNSSAKELEDMENMLEAAEKLYGPYQWGQYDVIFLPPSFPFGGMENPRLTFATPTILAGDKSLVSLVAHELAHSWSGNLVTNATWNDFWLNEGFTVYFEYRIMEEVYGKDVSRMLSLISYSDLQKELEALDYGEDTKLKLDLAGRNPDEGVTSIAYEKGYYFIKLIEQTIGKEAFDKFLNKYFGEHAFSSISTEEFLFYLNENLLKNYPNADSLININKWVYNTGLPENCPQIKSERVEKVLTLAKEFTGEGKVPKTEASKWMYQEWVLFLREIADSVDTQKMQVLDQNFNLSNSGNSEILFEWLMLAVKHNYQPAYRQLDNFLMNVGRRKFIAPLYEEMNANPKLQNLAKNIYKKARPSYHYVSINSIDKILNIDQ
ncbi:M1 family metallopeptidase [Chondrinema litorale]|uniref:M1 family metallopeptidase n=1 Tax=Chondrinema litorale TaxID=2994555 RepID=UPI002542FA78|nr:M1 family metallopeptidase [Chondrinema litorale]UZR94049.1 M1 family metallopeptidase [Chondrinema litorale]